MNILQVATRSYEYDTGDGEGPRSCKQAEFIVDGIGLCERLNFERARPWFGRTCFDEMPDTWSDC